MIKPKAPPFVMIFRELLKDPKWRKLSNSAKVLYIYLRAKFNAKTLNELTLTYIEMKDVMTTATMSKGLKELQRTGFIEKTVPGGLFRGKSKYKLKGEHKHFYYKGKRL